MNSVVLRLTGPYEDGKWARKRRVKVLFGKPAFVNKPVQNEVYKVNCV